MSDNGSDDARFDAFQPDKKSGYSPEKFYTRSSGKEGTASARFPVTTFPMEVIAELDELIATKAFPEYKTKATFFRDAVVHLLNLRKHQLKNQVFANKVDIWTRLAEAERMKSVNGASRELLNVREDSFRSERDPKQIARIVEECKTDLASIESEHYRNEMLDLIRRYDRG